MFTRLPTNNSAHVSSRTGKGSTTEYDGDTYSSENHLAHYGSVRSCQYLRISYFDGSSDSDENGEVCQSNTLEPNTFSAKFKPVLRILQIFGYFAAPLDLDNSWQCLLGQRLLLGLILIVFITVNGLLFTYNMIVTHHSRKAMGGWHAYTITTIITGLLPLLNFLNLLIFARRLPHHRKMLQYFDTVSTIGCFRLHQCWNIAMNTLCITFFLLPLIAHLFHHILVRGSIKDWLDAVAIVLVPLLRVWQLLPLVYFIMIGSHIQSWFIQLQHYLSKRSETQVIQPRLEECYYIFIVLTKALKKFGRAMDMFVLITIFFSTLTLCLTIYFVTQVDSLIDQPPIGYNVSDTQLGIHRLNAYFDIGWSGFQIIVSILSILIICKIGWNINEEARHFQSYVLTVNTETADDRFQIMRFTIKIRTQIEWGMTVWKAFLIERGLLFTIVSTILAYALILNQLRTHTTDPSVDNQCS